jgi:hypothetical protein
MLSGYGKFKIENSNLKTIKPKDRITTAAPQYPQHVEPAGILIIITR